MGGGRWASSGCHPNNRAHDLAWLAGSTQDDGQYGGTTSTTSGRVEGDCGATCSTCRCRRGTSSHPRNRAIHSNPTAAIHQGGGSPEATAMKWFWQRGTDPDTVEAARDLSRARAARVSAEKATEQTRSHWGLVHQITHESRTLRNENHLAQSIIELFRSRP
jgi:hypothetical protein